MSGWNPNGEISNENALLADRTFSMLLLARVFVLLRFLQVVPAHVNLDNARRRWVFLQIMPASRGGDDIFTAILRNLRYGDQHSMLQLALVFLEECRENQLFGSSTPLYCAVDEAQEGINIHKDSFRSTSGAHRRPALHALYRFYDESNFFDGYIFAGTGLSMKELELTVGSISAKQVERALAVFTDTVHFTREESDVAHRDYIFRYLKLSGKESNRLLQRILYWFRGRYVHLSRPSLLRY